MPPTPKAFLHRTLLISSLLLLSTSFITVGLTGHASWLLEHYFPGGEWYIWKGFDATTYEEQQTPQQWVTVEYDRTTERLAYMRAVLGIVAGVLGVWAMYGGDAGIKVFSFPYPIPGFVTNDGEPFKRLADV
jgi:hypothetical protein